MQYIFTIHLVVLTGVKTRILELYPKALFTHCGAHVLNLALGDSCKILSMVKMFGTVQQLGVFFSSSAKRTDALATHVPGEQSVRRTKLLSPTRWSSRDAALTALIDLMEPVAETLDELAISADTDTKQKAAVLSGNILLFIRFFVTFFIYCYLFSKFLVLLQHNYYFFQLRSTILSFWWRWSWLSTTWISLLY